MNNYKLTGDDLMRPKKSKVDKYIGILSVITFIGLIVINVI